LYIDLQLSPRVAQWMTRAGQLPCTHLLTTPLGVQKDADVFFKLKKVPTAVIVSKDVDFPRLLARHGPPPRVLWLRCGNTPDNVLIALLKVSFPRAVSLLKAGESLVEIVDAQSSARPGRLP
jgi:predicted nuclease of predicted toxin-antitoxin system